MIETFLLHYFFMVSVMASSSRPVIRVTGFASKPYLDLSELRTSKFPGGLDMQLVHIMADHLDFDIKFNASKTWGTLNRNGTWSGTIGEVVKLLVEGRADVGIGELSIAYPRSQYVTFSTPIYFEDLFLLSNKPKALPQHFNLIKPFNMHIWMFIILAFLAAATLQPRLPNPSPIFSCESVRRVLRVFGSMFLQGNADLMPRPLSRMLFSVAWLIFVTVLVMAYNCNLRAYLIHLDYEKPIDGPEDVLEQQRNFYYEKGSKIEFIIHSEGQGPFKKMVERAHREKHHFRPLIHVTTEFVMELHKEDRVIMATPSYSSLVVAKAKQDMGHNPFRLGTQTQMLVFCGFAFSKESSVWQKPFNKVLRRLVEAGIVDKLRSEHSTRIADDKRDEDADIPLNIDHAIIPCLILGIGLFLALVTLGLEIAHGHRQKTRRIRPITPE